METWHYLVSPVWQPPAESSAELIHSDCHASVVAGVPGQGFIAMASLSCFNPSDWSRSVCFCSLSIYWSAPVASEVVLTCNWALHLPDLPPCLSITSGHPFTWAVRIMKAWLQYFPSFLCSLLCGLMQIPDFNKQLLNMSLTRLGLQMRLCYWDYSVSYSFVMSFVNHSWPAVYRIELRLSSFFLWLLSFFSQRITILLPERLITCTNKRVWDINTKFTGFSLSQTCNSLYISSW